MAEPGPLRVVFLAHAFPRTADDVTGGFLLRLARALRAEGVEVAAVAPAAEGLPAAERLDGIPVRRYRYAPARAQRLAYAGEMHRRAASPCTTRVGTRIRPRASVRSPAARMAANCRPVPLGW